MNLERVLARELALPGVIELSVPEYADARGSFLKLVHRSSMESLGFDCDFREVFCTISSARVLRGIHTQAPPAAHAKLVHCLGGGVLDVAVDLRKGSPTFKRAISLSLTAQARNAVYLPPGIAHGFYVREAPAILLYLVTAEHRPDLDTGVRWNSIDIAWDDPQPVLSDRDRRLPSLAEFDSPFVYSPR
jgi:dTDP-4-dehydrorhamnose 3,5-epimerase